MTDADTLAVNDGARPAPDHFHGEPPEGIAAKTRGLPPQRARLARFLAWQQQTAADLAAATATRSRLIEGLGVPAVTESSIMDLVRADVAGLISWAKSRKTSISPTAPLSAEMVRSIERDRLERRLADDRHRLEVARAAVTEADAEIAGLEAGVALLAERHGAFLRAALAEEIDRHGEVYLRHLFAMRDALRLMLAASEAAGVTPSGRAFVAPRMPTPLFDNVGGSNGIAIDFGRVEMERSQALWSVLASQWATDPSVDPVAVVTAALPADEFQPSGGVMMPVFLHQVSAVLKASHILIVAPAADLPEQDPLPEWLSPFNGEPENFRVDFAYGRAEVPTALGQYLIKRGHALATPLDLES